MNVKLCAILLKQMLSPYKTIGLSDRVPVLPRPGSAMQYNCGKNCILNITIKYGVRVTNNC